MNKQAFSEFTKGIAQFYSVDPAEIAAGNSFALEAPKAAALAENIQQKSDFLKQINLVQVTDVSGYKLWGATEKGITGRKPAERYYAQLNHTQDKYELVKTDSGVIIPWDMFDNFARFGGALAAKYAEFVQTQIALDMLQIGWNGKTAAATTTAEDLSDVNKGWLALLAEQKAENVLQQGKKAGTIKIYGDGADFENLDALAFDLKQGLHLRHRDRNDLVFLVGADLVSAETKFIYKAQGHKPTERAALNSNELFGTFGGMRAMTPPNFPAKGAVVTTLSNLSVYTQSNSVRRRIKDDHDRMGIIDQYYRNEGYVVEDLGLMTAINAANVVIGEPTATKA